MGLCLDHVLTVSTFSTTIRLIELATFWSMDTMELCGDQLHPGEKLETPGLVLISSINNKNKINNGTEQLLKELNKCKI